MNIALKPDVISLPCCHTCAAGRHQWCFTPYLWPRWTKHTSANAARQSSFIWLTDPSYNWQSFRSNPACNLLMWYSVVFDGNLPNNVEQTCQTFYSAINDVKRSAVMTKEDCWCVDGGCVFCVSYIVRVELSAEACCICRCCAFSNAETGWRNM